MNCPECDGKTNVVDSRKVEDMVARKRKCIKCGHIIYTEEIEVEDHNTLSFFWKKYNSRRR